MTASELRKSCAEETRPHTRIMKCTLEVEPARAYWVECGLAGGPISKAHAFERAIFGSKTYQRVDRLIADMRHRFDAFPAALSVLSGWHEMNPADRVMVCHWHTQLADPLYRRFTGEFMVSRSHSPRPLVDRNMVIRWIESQLPDRWQYPTKSKIASNLMSSALTAGLLGSNRDPRPIQVPRVSDTALTYLMYLLREVEFVGTLIANPYVASVGFDTDEMTRRLRAIPAVGFCRQGELTDFQWQYNNLHHWAESAGLLCMVSAEGGAR